MPRRRFEIRMADGPAMLELGEPVPGEVRREPIADADAPCPRCGNRSWLLVERRAEAEQPFTRWRAYACARCGGADGWQAGGRTRPGRGAERYGPPEDAPPERLTLEEVCRRAPFLLLAPVGLEVRLRAYGRNEDGSVDSATVGNDDVEVTTGWALQSPFPDDWGLRQTLRILLFIRAREPLRRVRSEAAQQLADDEHMRRAEELAARPEPGQITLAVDGTAAAFTMLEHDGIAVAEGVVGSRSVGICSTGTPLADVSLRSLR